MLFARIYNRVNAVNDSGKRISSSRLAQLYLKSRLIHKVEFVLSQFT